MKIITVVGARPQFIKAAAVSREIASHPDIKEIIVHTGQHFDRNMSDIFFEEMDIPRPDYHLDVHSLNHGAMTGRMLEKIEEVLLREHPDIVMVYGDTNSTLAGALAAKKLHIRLVHVEAGLRSFNMLMPEEVNRILTDRISDILCCPTDTAIRNLAREGFSLNNSGQRGANHPPLVLKTGDVMQDAALHYAQSSSEKTDIVYRLGLTSREFALCTLHRAENTDFPIRLKSIINALHEISLDIPVVCPLHPRTRGKLQSIGIDANNHPQTTNRQLYFIDPVSYFEMIELLKSTKIVITDSGGLQKEAFFFGKPCVTLRDETEWTELIEGGFNRLAGAEQRKIMETVYAMKSISLDFSVDFYGKGKAGWNIVRTLKTAHPDRECG